MYNTYRILILILQLCCCTYTKSLHNYKRRADSNFIIWLILSWTTFFKVKLLPICCGFKSLIPRMVIQNIDRLLLVVYRREPGSPAMSAYGFTRGGSSRLADWDINDSSVPRVSNNQHYVGTVLITVRAIIRKLSMTKCLRQYL